VASVLSSLRYLLADFIGDDDGAQPLLPEGLPDSAVADVSDGIHLLTDYQGPSYAQLYVDRVKRFVGRNGVDEAMSSKAAFRCVSISTVLQSWIGQAKIRPLARFVQSDFFNSRMGTAEWATAYA